MMREIKIRVWGEREKEMFYSDDEMLTFSSENKRINYRDIFSHFKHRYKKMLYISSKDKNGKEIFEGDIVDYWNPNGDYVGREVIEYKEGTGYEIRTPFVEDYDLTTLGWAIKDGYKFEVIGNEYEDGDLVESS